MDASISQRGFQTMFANGRLTLGLFLPIEAYQVSIPTMVHHQTLVQRADQAGFAAIWVRDVPLLDPSFGEVGQIYDPWVYSGYLAASTQTIALATGSIVLPLRHPLHVAKAAASVDSLSGGRLVLGLASGDRVVEFPAFGLDAEERGEQFRELLAFLRRALEERFPEIESPLGVLRGADLIPKPVGGRLPLVALNLKSGHRPATEVLEELGSDVSPYFQTMSRQPGRGTAEWSLSNHDTRRESCTT